MFPPCPRSWTCRRLTAVRANGNAPGDSEETGMAGNNKVVRSGQLSHHAAARRRAASRKADARLALAAGNGLESLESRLLMSAVRPDASFSTQDLGVGDD